MNSNIELRITWHRITDTYWYPERWLDNVSRVSTWRAALHINGDVSALKSVETNGLLLTLDWEAGLARWGKINQVDRIEQTDDGVIVWLPRLAEPEGEIFEARFFDGTTEWPVSTAASQSPHSSEQIDYLESEITWNEGQASLNVKSTESLNVLWNVQSDGKWNELDVASFLEAGNHKFQVEVPFAEVAYLEIRTISGKVANRHRYYAVGRPGVATGRYVWYRGTMYAPKITRPLPWMSVVAPVLHPDDIERVPAFVKWNQVEWWVHHGTWTDEAIELIKTKFPKAGIVRLGPLGDADADVQVLRPLEVQGATLNRNVRYTVQLFDDAGDPEFARRSGWLMERLMREDVSEHRFLERSWRQGIIPQNPVDGLPQHGYGFSFTRPPDHEYLWPASQRDVDWRENKENFPCHKCQHRASCRQALPMPYASEDIRRVPWVSLERGDCPLPRWFALPTIPE